LGFNAFVETQTTLASTEAEGPIATGGDLIIDGAYNVSMKNTGTFTAGSDAQPSALVVGGGIDFPGSGATGVIRVLDQGYVKTGDLTGTEVLTTDDNGDALSTTGTAVRPLLIAAAALLAVGILVVIAAVRRRGDAPI
jgi:choice-of-anchor A domain-containing protein